MAGKEDKAKKQPQSTKKSGPDGAALIDAYLKQGGGVVGKNVFTQQEGDYVVQSLYQQMFGRNATGAEYSRALNTVMSQPAAVNIYGRQQALANILIQDPEYQAEQENKYLDAIYKAVATDVGKVR